MGTSVVQKAVATAVQKAVAASIESDAAGNPQESN
jgi:hypothetical protein